MMRQKERSIRLMNQIRSNASENLDWFIEGIEEIPIKDFILLCNEFHCLKELDQQVDLICRSSKTLNALFSQVKRIHNGKTYSFGLLPPDTDWAVEISENAINKLSKRIYSWKLEEIEFILERTADPIRKKRKINAEIEAIRSGNDYGPISRLLYLRGYQSAQRDRDYFDLSAINYSTTVPNDEIGPRVVKLLAEGAAAFELDITLSKMAENIQNVPTSKPKESKQINKYSGNLKDYWKDGWMSYEDAMNCLKENGCINSENVWYGKAQDVALLLKLLFWDDRIMLSDKANKISVSTMRQIARKTFGVKVAESTRGNFNGEAKKPSVTTFVPDELKKFFPLDIVQKFVKK